MSDNPATRASVGAALTKALRDEMTRWGLRENVKVAVSGPKIVLTMRGRTEVLDIDVRRQNDLDRVSMEIFEAALRLLEAATGEFGR